MIRYERFGGIMPRVHPEKLPPEAAQIAHNVLLRRGVVDLLSVSSPFVYQYNPATGQQLSQIAANQILYIPQPSAPSLSLQTFSGTMGSIPWEILMQPITNICQPANWLKIRARTWAVWLSQNDSSGQYTNVVNTSLIQDAPNLTPSNVNFTEGGCTFTVQVPHFINTFLQQQNLFRVIGPLFELDFTGGFDGGPTTSQSLPAQATWGDRRLPRGVVPLVHNTNVIASFQAADVQGPFYDQEFFVHDVVSQTLQFPDTSGNPATYTFSCNFNYSDKRRKHFYYLQSAMTNNPPANSLPDPYALMLGLNLGMEGPPSGLSPLITLLPGQQVTVALPLPTGYENNRLYRSKPPGDRFLMVADPNGTAVIDDGTGNLAIRLPEFGNYPATSADISGSYAGNDPNDIADFLEGSVLHPAEFGVAFRGNTIWCSDPLRLWVWPTRFTTSFPDPIQAIALSIHSIIAFVASSGDGPPPTRPARVYGLTGQHPRSLTLHLASETEPLLNLLGIAKVGHIVYWPTYDGLAAGAHDYFRGLSIDVLTREYFTRDQWMALHPDQFSARVADEAIFLDYIGSDSGALDTGYYPDPGAPYPTGGLRFDIKPQEKAIAITTYSSITPTAATWKSRREVLEQQATFDYARVVCDNYPVTLTVYANQASVGAYTVENDSAFDLGPLPFSRYWECQVDMANSVSAGLRLIELFDRLTLPVGADNAIDITGREAPNWRSIWFKYEALNAPRIGVLTLHGETTGGADTGDYAPGDYGTPPIPVEFYQDGTLVCSAQVSSRVPFPLPRTLVPSAFWRVKCETDLRVERLELHGLNVVAVEGPSVKETHMGIVAPWRYRRYEMPNQSYLTAAVVHSLLPSTGAPTLTLNIYADGALTPTLSPSVPEDGHIQFPAGTGPFKTLEFDFGAGDQYVTQAEILLGTVVPVEGAIIRETHGHELPPWWSRRYEVPNQSYLDEAIVNSSLPDSGETLTLNVYADGATTATVSQTVPDNGYVQFPPMTGPFKNLEFDFAGDDEYVTQVELMLAAVVPVEGTLIRETHGHELPAWWYKRYELADKSFLIGAVVHVPGAQSVTLCVYADGATTPTLSIAVPADGHVWIQPDSGPYKEVTFNFGGSDEYVSEVVLVFGPRYELVNGRVEIKHEGEPTTWIAQRVVGASPFDLSCGKILAQQAAYPLTVNVLHSSVDTGWTLIKSRTVADDRPFRFQMRRPERGFVVQVIPTSPTAFIHEAVFATSFDRLSPPLPPIMPMEPNRGQ